MTPAQTRIRLPLVESQICLFTRHTHEPPAIWLEGRILIELLLPSPPGKSSVERKKERCIRPQRTNPSSNCKIGRYINTDLAADRRCGELFGSQPRRGGTAPVASRLLGQRLLAIRDALAHFGQQVRSLRNRILEFNRGLEFPMVLLHELQTLDDGYVTLAEGHGGAV
jgi:hypothetical protein